MYCFMKWMLSYGDILNLLRGPPNRYTLTQYYDKFIIAYIVRERKHCVHVAKRVVLLNAALSW